MTTCPFCNRDPFCYVDVGVGSVPVAVDCCDLGDLWFRGARPPITHDVTMSAEEFDAIGQKLVELQGYREKYGELYPDAECKNCGHPESMHPVSPELQCPEFNR